MPLVEWTDRFLVGVEQIDEHHKQLVGLLNQAYDGFVQEAPKARCETLLKDLFDYASYHFVTEEFWMTHNSFPDIEAHIGEHNCYIRRLEELRQDFEAGNTSVSLEIFTFLASWLSEHILKADADFKHFIVEQEIELETD